MIKGYEAPGGHRQALRHVPHARGASCGCHRRDPRGGGPDGAGGTRVVRVRKDGSRFWAHETATPIRDEDGRLLGFTKATAMNVPMSEAPGGVAGTGAGRP
ncbi:MAG: PAS domain S-box protein [Chloroflexota bacterium]